MCDRINHKTEVKGASFTFSDPYLYLGRVVFAEPGEVEPGDFLRSFLCFADLHFHLHLNVA